MRITRLQVRDIRRYRDLDITLAPGLTVIRGANEAGKTTIQRALELALTRKVTSTHGDLDALRPWDADLDAHPVIALEFVQEDEEGTRTGSLEKAFRGGRGTVRLEVNGDATTDPSRADELLAELTGVPTEAFFRSTASIRHHELHAVNTEEGALRDRLQASISGADRGTSVARKKLDRALKDLTKAGDKNPGRLKVAEEAVARSQALVERGEAQLQQLGRDREALILARERRSDAETALSERRSLLEKARQAERFAVERQAATERFDRYRQAVQINEELAKLHATHPSATPVSVLRRTVERVRQLETQISTLKAALAGEVEVQFDVPPEPTWRPLSRWALALVVLGLLIGVIGFVTESFDLAGVPVIGGSLAPLNVGNTPLYLGGAAAGIGFILAFVAWWLRRSSIAQGQLRDVEIERRLRGRSQMEQELRESESESAAQLEMLGLEDVAAANGLLASEEAHVASIDRLTAQLGGLIGKETAESLPSLRDAAALEIEQKTHALEAIGPIAREPRARERLEVEVRDQEVALERARDDEANARARLEANSVDEEQVSGEAERLAGWREELAALQRRARVYDHTLRAIERAERATMRTATRYLEKWMVADVARITGGRYRRVKVDDQTLGIRVFAPERGDWVDVEELSQGTLDQVYLAARIGLVRLVTGDRRPPLVFDDPFVTFDDDRAARALELLREVAHDFQVIYLTTSDRYDAVADAVVELPAPTAIDDGVDDSPAGTRSQAGATSLASATRDASAT